MSVWFVFFEFWQEKGDAHHEEDNKDPCDVDENSLRILERIRFVGPDGLLQVPHEGGRGSQHQDTGAEVLVERQEQSPDVARELWEQECQESQRPLTKKFLLAGIKFW